MPARHLPAMLRNASRAGRSRSGEFPILRNSGVRIPDFGNRNSEAGGACPQCLTTRKGRFEEKKKSGESEGPESSLSEIWNKTGGEKNAVTVQPLETGLTGEIFSSC